MLQRPSRHTAANDPRNLANSLATYPTDSFRYRWTGSCIANLEYEPEDMLKAVLYALSSSEVQDCPFLVVLILPA